jgi:two-component system, response regulator
MNDFADVEVLLVEDNQSDAEMTMRALDRANLINKVYWVKDGVEALEFVRCTGPYESRDCQQSLKLILLDLKMPRLDGLGVLRELKSGEQMCPVPIVVMTSSNQDHDIAEAYRLGVNGYVTKPVQFASFVESVSRIGMYWLMVNQAPTL